MLLNRDKKLNPPKSRCVKKYPQLYAKPSPFPNFLGQLSANVSQFLGFLQKPELQMVPAGLLKTGTAAWTYEVALT